MNTNTTVAIPEVTVTKEGVPFIVKRELCAWVHSQSGASYWYSHVEAIAVEVRRTLGWASRVELYGAPDTERLYAKVISDDSWFEQEWVLQFPKGEVRCVRIG